MRTKGFLWWVVFSLLVIWQLPEFIVSIIMLPFMGKLKVCGDRHFNFCFSSRAMNGGISLGPFSFVSTYISDELPDGYIHICHELDGHTVDSKIFGPLYLFVIGIPSILNAMFRFTKCYYSFYTERLANKHAGIQVDDNCRLHMQ